MLVVKQPTPHRVAELSSTVYADNNFNKRMQESWYLYMIDVVSVCLWFRYKVLRIGPKGLCVARRALVPAQGSHLVMHRM